MLERIKNGSSRNLIKTRVQFCSLHLARCWKVTEPYLRKIILLQATSRVTGQSAQGSKNWKLTIRGANSHLQKWFILDPKIRPFEEFSLAPLQPLVYQLLPALKLTTRQTIEDFRTFIYHLRLRPEREKARLTGFETVRVLLLESSRLNLKWNRPLLGRLRKLQGDGCS